MTEKNIYNIDQARFEAVQIRKIINKDPAKKEDYEKADVKIENYRNGLREILNTAIEHSDGQLSISEDGVLLYKNKESIGNDLDTYMDFNKTDWTYIYIKRFYSDMLEPLEKLKLIEAYKEAVKKLNDFGHDVMSEKWHNFFQDWTNDLLAVAGADEKIKRKQQEEFEKQYQELASIDIGL